LVSSGCVSKPRRNSGELAFLIIAWKSVDDPLLGISYVFELMHEEGIRTGDIFRKEAHVSLSNDLNPLPIRTFR
jgi:hypothetical protein